MSNDGVNTKRRDWRDGPAWAVCLMALYIALACLPVGLAWALTPRTGASFWRELGKGAALLGFSLMALQFTLAGRFKTVDRPFGLDIVMRFHKLMGMCAGALLVLHPVLLLVDSGNLWLLSFKPNRDASRSCYVFLVGDTGRSNQYWRASIGNLD